MFQCAFIGITVRDTGPCTEAFRSWFAVFTAVAGKVKGEVNEGSVERIRAHGAVWCLYWDCGPLCFNACFPLIFKGGTSQKLMCKLLSVGVCYERAPRGA